MRCIFVLVATCLLAGCASKGDTVGFNRHVINTPYGDDTSYASAVATLTEEATKICNEGYRKVNDYDTTSGSKRILVWEVGCLGVVRTDKRFGTKNTGELHSE